MSMNEQLNVQSLLWDTSCDIIVAFSGGKDSLAMVLYLMKLGISKDRIKVHHHDVDGDGINMFDWPCTPAYCEAVCRHLGVDLVFSHRDGGIMREIYRENEGLQPVSFQPKPGSAFVSLPSRPGNSTRHKFPAVAASLMTRWCSAVVKIDVMSRVVNNHPRYRNGGDLLILTGERREESKNRAKYLEHEKYRSHTKKKNFWQWRPIIDWTEDAVWDIIKESGIQPHPAYMIGWGRCSCMTCIFNSSDHWATINDIDPGRVELFRDVETEIGHTLYNKMTINQKVDKGFSFYKKEDEPWVEQAMSSHWYMPTTTDVWVQPKGAFKGESCGSV